MVTNLFTNPNMVATDGEVVVWENLALDPRVEGTWGGDSRGTRTNIPGGGVEVEIVGENAANNLLYETPVSGEWSTRTAAFEVENVGESPIILYMRTYDGTSYYPTNGQHVTIGPGETKAISQTIVDYNGDGYYQPRLNAGATLPIGTKFVVHRVWVTDLPVVIPYFDETFSPDPDLTPQPRPGGGSQLVGQRVAGLAATNGAVVQSEQWAKSRGVSGRIINNTGSPVTVALDDASVFTRLWTYDGARETLATLASPSVIPGPATLGESKWVDLITSTAQRYDGPLFSGSTPNSADDSGYGWVYEWVGAPDASASTREYTQVRDVAIMVVEDLDAPAVGITVEGLSSVEASRVAIYRQTPGKERTLVQGLGNVDVDGAGYWVDYLPPLGVPVTYVVEVLEGDPLEDNEATITIPSKTAWLQDALNPLLAVEVACRPGNRDTLFFTAEAFTAFERPTNSDLVSIMGGRVPVGMTSRRQTPVGIPFNMVTTAAEASSMLREVLIEGTHLVLRVPPEISMLDPVTYLSDVQVSEEPGRQSFLGGHVIRWNMTGSQTRGPRIMAWTALWTYDDVAELYAGYSYTDLTDGRRYVDWQARPDEAQLAGFSATSSGGSNA